MRILAFTPFGSMIGGANRSFFSVVSNLVKEYHHEITVVVPAKGALTEALDKEKIPYMIIPASLMGTKIKGDIFDIYRIIKANLKALNNFIFAMKNFSNLKHNYDLIYINCTDQFIGYYVSKKLKVPVVWHFRGSIGKRSYYTINQKRLFNKLNGKIIAISTSMYNDLQQEIGINQDNIVKIFNGLELYNKKPSKQKLDDGVNCLICGRLIPIKGQLEAINSIGMLVEMGYDVKLYVVGSTPGAVKNEYLETLKDRVRELKMENRVFFEGQVSDINSFRENMNLELICSEKEPFGRVTVEAMQSNLIVIAANTGGTLDIVKDGYNGLLYEQGSSRDLADKIIYVIENIEKAKELAKNGYEFAKTNFTIEENVRNINNVMIWVTKKS